MGTIRKLLVRTSEDWSLVAGLSTNIKLRIYHPVFPTKGMLCIHLIAANEADYHPSCNSRACTRPFAVCVAGFSCYTMTVSTIVQCIPYPSLCFLFGLRLRTARRNAIYVTLIFERLHTPVSAFSLATRYGMQKTGLVPML